MIPIGLEGIGWRSVHRKASWWLRQKLTESRFYIVGVVWNIFVAAIIYFTYLETSGLTLEQIDQRFNGVPRDQLVDITEIFDGMKPISEGEINDNAECSHKAGETTKV